MLPQSDWDRRDGSGGEEMCNAIAMIAMVIAVICVGINQIITNSTIVELQLQLRRLRQQLEQQ